MSALPAPATATVSASEALISTGTEWGSTRWATLSECGQKYDLRYRRLILPLARPSYFGIGSLVHAGITYCESAVAAGLEPRDWRDVMREAEAQAREAEAQGVLAPFEIEQIWEAERLLAAYDAQWGLSGADAGWPSSLRIAATELHLDSSFSGIPLTGRLDTLLITPEGDYIIVDTKTAAARVSLEPEKRAQWARGQATRPQFLMLSYMLRALVGPGPEISFMVNRLSKARIPVAERIRIPITESAVAAWAENQLETAAEFARGAVPIRNYSACAPAMGNQCEYFDYCHGSEESRERNFAASPCAEAGRDPES